MTHGYPASMTLAAILAIAGGLFGALGSIVTAFSLNRLFAELRLAQEFLGITVEAYVNGIRDVPMFEGMQERYETAKKHGSTLTWIGVVLLALGFIFQAASVVISEHTPTPVSSTSSSQLTENEKPR